MKKTPRAVLFVLFLLASFLCAPRAQNVNELEKLPIEFTYSLDSLLLPSDADATMNAFHLGDVNVSLYRFEVLLTNEEKSRFNRAISHLKKSNEYLESANAAMAYVGNTLNRVVIGSTGVIGAGVYLQHYLPKVRDVARYSLLSLGEADIAINEAVNVLGGDVDELLLAGVNYTNYTGYASGTYSKIKDVLVQARRTHSGDAGDAGMKYGNALNLIKTMQNDLLSSRSSIRFSNPNVFPESMTLTVGDEECVLILLAKLDTEVRDALEKMNNEYNALADDTETKARQVKQEIEMMKSERYDLIEENVAGEFGGATTEATVEISESASSPSALLLRVVQFADNPGIEPGASQLILLAREIHGEKNPNYIARAIEKLKLAQTKLANAEQLVKQAKDDVALLTRNAEYIVDAESMKTSFALDNFHPKNSAESDALESARKIYSEAKADADAARYAKAGVKLRAYSKSLDFFAQARGMIAPSSLERASEKDEAKKYLDVLERVTALAEKDDVDVSYEREQLGIFRDIIDASSEEMLASISYTSRELADGIYERAAMKYKNLDGERESLSQIFLSLGEIVSGSSSIFGPDYSRFSEYEREFVSGGKIQPRLALGKYKELESFYAQLSSKLQTYSSNILADHLQKHAEVEMFFDEVPELDKETQVTITVSLANNLNLASQKPVLVEIKSNLPLAPPASAITKKSSEISDVVFTREKITILLSNVEPYAAYSFSLGTGAALASTTSRAESFTYIRADEARKNEKIKFSAKTDLAVLKIQIKTQTYPYDARAFFDGIEANVSAFSLGNATGATITLQNVKAGDSEVLFGYSIPDPYTVQKTNSEIVQSGALARLTFDMSVGANEVELRDVPVEILEPTAANIRERSVSVLGLGGAETKNLEIKNTGVGLYIRWLIPRLSPGAPARYRVSYEVDNQESYANLLISEVKKLAEDKNLSGDAAIQNAISDADAFLGIDKFADAIEEAMRAQNLILSASTDYVRSLKTNSLENELAQLAELEKNANATVDALVRAGYDAQADALRSKISEADSLVLQASLLRAQGKLEQATEIVLRAKQSLESADILKTLASRRDELAEQINNAKRISLLLGQLADTSELEQLTGEAGEEFALADAGIQKGDAIAALSGFERCDGIMRNVSDSAGNISNGVFDALFSRKEEFKDAELEFEKSSSALERALAVTVDDTIRKSAKTGFSGSSPSTLKSTAASITLHLENVFDAMGRARNKTGFVVENARNLATVGDELETMRSLVSEAQNSLSDMQRKTNLSYENARLSLKQVAEIADGNEQINNEMGNLSTRLGESKKAAGEGRFADAVLLSNYIQYRSAYLLKNMPAKTGGETQSIIIAISLLFIAALLFIFLRRKPEAEKSQKALKQIKRLEK